MSNIIDASERFAGLDRVNSKLYVRHQKLVDDVKSCARNSREDRLRMARNLGVLAKRLSPDDPRKGARRMFEKLGVDWKSKWDKRHRLLLYPDEPMGKEDLESSGATFIRLAEAAGELLAVGRSDTLVEKQKLSAIHFLLSGTRWMDELPSESSALATGRELLADALEHIARNIGATTSLRELWDVLDVAPFTKHFVGDGNEPDRSPDPLQFAREQYVLALAAAGGTAVPKAFGPGDDVTWSRPRIQLGCLAIRKTLRLFRFPEAFDDVNFKDPEEGEDGDPFLSPQGVKWLAEIGFRDGQLPDVEYDPERGFGWDDVDLWKPYNAFMYLAACRSFRSVRGMR